MKETVRRYYVETLRGNGQWVRFTKGLLSEAEGESHLAMMSVDPIDDEVEPRRFRLRRLNDEEFKREILTEYRERFESYLVQKPLSELAFIAGLLQWA